LFHNKLIKVIKITIQFVGKSLQNIGIPFSKYF